MTNRKSLLSACLAFVTAIPFLAGPYQSSAATDSSPANSQIRIVTVVKRTGLAWFDRMQKGIEQFAAQTGVNATMTGAPDADPQKQAEIIRKLIAEKPNAITSFPTRPPHSNKSSSRRAKPASKSSHTRPAIRSTPTSTSKLSTTLPTVPT